MAKVPVTVPMEDDLIAALDLRAAQIDRSRAYTVRQILKKNLAVGAMHPPASALDSIEAAAKELARFDTVPAGRERAAILDATVAALPAPLADRAHSIVSGNGSGRERRNKLQALLDEAGQQEPAHAVAGSLSAANPEAKR